LWEVDTQNIGWYDSFERDEEEQHSRAKDALTWAAYTYFVSALASIATLIYLILRFTSSRD
jgi:Zn-dependent membrane protease YugP